jgi:hypothetical protein
MPQGKHGYGPIRLCQVCDSTDLESVLFLGFLPPVNRMRPVGVAHDEEVWYPAEMLACARCKLVQLGYAADPSVLFPPDYPYTSGSTRILRENFSELCKEAHQRIRLTGDDLVVDIGSNDGTLLSNFQQAGRRVLGVEPSLTGKLAEARGIPTRMSFFGPETAREILQTHGQAKLVTAANVFAHIHGVHDIVDGIAKLVGDDGVFISESHYLVDLVDTLQYDTIYHEHLRYYSLTSLSYLLTAHGFTVFHVKRIPTHGGSIRVYATRAKNVTPDASVASTLRAEREAGFASHAWVPAFRKRVLQSKLELYEMLSQIKRRHARIYGIGAPSRASTLLTYLGMGSGVIDCVLELSESKKLNKYMPGTNVPVLDEAKLYADQPEYVLLLSWHIADELCSNLRKHGYQGDFIVPLPRPCIVANRVAAAA